MNTSDTQSTRSLLRGADGFTSAFDLEVWKAQQQARFKSQLTQAKEELERGIRLEWNKKNRRDVEEMEKAKRELEGMARQLQSAAELLKQRSQQFEQREAAFEARRVKVAEQHERHLAKVEERAQRLVEEHQLQIADLKAQLREKDNMLVQSEEKRRVAESDYEMLRRKASKLIVEGEKSGEGRQLRELQGKLASVEDSNLELQRQLKMALDDVARLERSNTALETEVQDCRAQAADWNRKYTRLLEQWRERESEYLNREREAVEEKRKELRNSSRQADLARQLQLPLAASVGLPAGDDLLHMLRDLQSEVAAGLRDVQYGGGRTAAPRIVYAEQPMRSIAPPSPPMVSTAPSPQRPAAEKEGDRSVEVEVQSCGTPPPPTAVEMSATSSYPPVESSWLEGMEWGPTVEGLPPLAPPAPHSHSLTDGDSLSPSDLVKVRDGGREENRSSTREEMTNFVLQLKMNRQKLLDTGVYTEDHAVVKEMVEKIKAYEEYLRKY